MRFSASCAFRAPPRQTLRRPPSRYRWRGVVAYNAGRWKGAPMNLQTRVVNILTKPASEWQVIAGEPTDVATLYTSYIVILAAIPAIATFLGLTLLSMGLGIYFGFALRLAIVSYVVGLAACY